MSMLRFLKKIYFWQAKYLRDDQSLLTIPIIADTPPKPMASSFSQAEFDDMPLPTAASRSAASSRNFGGLQQQPDERPLERQAPQVASAPEKKAGPQPGAVQKRPFLQRRSSPNKIINKNTAAATTTTAAGKSKTKVGNFSFCICK